jgi:hypothetical protein
LGLKALTFRFAECRGFGCKSIIKRQKDEHELVHPVFDILDWSKARYEFNGAVPDTIFGGAFNRQFAIDV